MAASGVFAAVTAALNTVGKVVDAQAASLGQLIGVSQQDIAYHSNVEGAVLTGANIGQQQATILIAVIVVAVFIFLLMILFMVK